MESSSHFTNSQAPLFNILPEVLEGFFRNNPGTQEVTITSNQIEQLCAYWDLVKTTNTTMNLTRVTDDLDAAYLHFADSLSPLFFNLIPMGATLCDLGSGAGFPGIPLSILRPDLHVVLVDSLEKRVRFLQECVTSLSLSCTCIHARAEEYGHGSAREQFDCVVSRAVARMQILSEWTLPLCRIGGTVLYYKGPALSQELKPAENAIRVLGGGKSRILPYILGNDSTGHQLFVLEKNRKTPPQFPRKGSAKKPLS